MSLDAVGAHRLQHVEGGDGVLLEILARMLEAEADVGVGGEMEHDVAAGHRGSQRRRVEDVAFDQLESVDACSAPSRNSRSRS